MRALAENCWSQITLHFPNVVLDEWVVMPNHIHSIIVIRNRGYESDRCPGVQLNASTRSTVPALNSARARFSRISARPNTISTIVRSYKGAVTAGCRASGHGKFAWQRSYYEHVIRNEDDMSDIRSYILENPLKWEMDENNPNKV